MKALVACVTRMHGKGKNTGNNYDFGTCTVLNPVQPFTRENTTFEGYGFQPGEIALSPEALQQFAGIKLPAVLDLRTDMELRSGKMEPIVIGINS